MLVSEVVEGMLCQHLYEHILVTLTFQELGQNFHSTVTLIRWKLSRSS